MKKAFLLTIVLFQISGISCKGNLNLPRTNSGGIFEYHYTGNDSVVIKDIKNALDNNYRRICDDLEYQYDYKIQVYIYPDQKKYDDNLTDKSVTGSPACSAGRSIQLVSPDSPIHIPGIPYSERLLMPVHEFVHLMVDEINSNLPIWIDEGLAAVEGSSNMYEYFCRTYFPQLPLIEVKDLEEDYNNIPGSDIYSYSAVLFIKENFGLEKLNLFIRKPENFEKIFSITKAQFNKEWNTFISKKYRNQ